MKISIIIPAYNEEKRIGRTLEEYCTFFRNLKEQKLLDFEILVILNNCKDNTLKVVEIFQRKFNEIKFLNFERGGKGFAVIEGFKNALERKNDLIGFIDADMATSPQSFLKLIDKCKNVDGVIASRGLKESIVRTSFTRKLTNRGFNFCVRSILLLPYKDTQCGAKIFKRKPIEKIVNELGMTRWAFDVDLLFKLRRNRFKIIESQTIWEDRKDSKLNLIKTPIQMFVALIRLRFVYSPFNIFTKVLRPVGGCVWRIIK